MKDSRERIIKRIEELALLLDGSCQHITTCNYLGRQSKKIVVEYDVHENK